MPGVKSMALRNETMYKKPVAKKKPVKKVAKKSK